MGIETKTVTVITCDLCGNTCSKEDGIVKVQVHPGDGRDVGPGYMEGRVSLFIPYRCNDGIVCRACKIKWLRTYVDHQQNAAQGGGDHG